MAIYTTKILGKEIFAESASYALTAVTLLGLVTSASYALTASYALSSAGGGGGGVTSVSASGVVSGLTLAGGPITSTGTVTLSGTLAVTSSNFSSQAPNAFLAGPGGGGSAVPTFRAIVGADIPTLNQNTTGTASTASYATNAATASLIRTVVTGYPASHYLTFVDANNDTPIAESLYTDANINFNPSINRLEITGSLIVSGSGTFTGTQILSGSLIFALPTSPAFNGEIVRFGSGTLTTGQLYFLSSSGTWSLANASSTGSSTGMLGIATGTSPTTAGLLVRGYAASSSYTTATGSIVYAATSSGLMTTSSPTSSNHVVRVVGYVTTIPNTIYFTPDPTFITLA